MEQEQHVEPVAEMPSVAASGGAGPEGLTPWGILTLAGAALLLAAMFLPWWSASIDSDGKTLDELEGEMRAVEKDSPDVVIDLADAIVYNLDWYAFHVTPQMIAEPVYDNFRDFIRDGMEYSKKRSEVYRSSEGWEETERRLSQMKEPSPPELDVTVSLAGWRTGTGVLGVFMALLAAALVLLPMMADILRPWVWTGQLLIACVTVLLLLFAIIFMFTCPGKDVEIGKAIEFSQGVSYGIFIELAGLILLGMGAGFSSIRGVQRLQARFGKPSANLT